VADGIDRTIADAERTFGSRLSNPPPESNTDAAERLAKLPPGECDRVRRIDAKRLDIRVGTLDDLVQKVRRNVGGVSAGSSLVLSSPEPWPEPVNLAELLDEFVAAIRRHVILPAEAALVIALWIAHTWVYEKFEQTPRLAITSPTERCGKSADGEIAEAHQAYSSRPFSEALTASLGFWYPHAANRFRNGHPAPKFRPERGGSAEPAVGPAYSLNRAVLRTAIQDSNDGWWSGQ
jgi:hypothetical protein